VRITIPNRRLAGTLVSLILAYPASGSVPLTRWNIHLWQRLRSAHQEAPQASFDRYLRTVQAYVPAHGQVGLVLAGPPDREDAFNILFRLQYALAPRQIVSSSDCEFVIVYGPLSVETPIADAAAFQLIKAVGDDLRVFRRVAR
jgi:hypothetical protein